MFNDKKKNIILSLIVAIALWAYVVGEIDPTITQEYKDIPIKLVNENHLTDNGLSILELSDETINITLSAKRSVMNRINPSDIVATVDLREVAKGKNEIKIDVRVPEKTEIEDKTINMVTITVEESTSEEKEVRVVYKGKFDDNEEANTVSVSHKTVAVSGAESEVAKVSYVQAALSASKVRAKEGKLTTQLVPVDAKGNEVDNVTLNYKKVTVETMLLKTKQVELKVNITGETSGENIERKVTKPETIVIKGASSIINPIKSISTELVDISNITENTEITLKPILPNGVEISSKSKELVLGVAVTKQAEEAEGDSEKQEKKNFEFSAGDVQISGLEDEKSINLTDTTIKVTLTGTKSQLENISKDDITLSVSVADLDDGKHDVNLEYSCSKECENITCDKESIELEIE